jgi:SAM-dependent methyltransferase
MAGWDSHIPDSISPQKVVGLGLNPQELAGNRALDKDVIHDLNRNPLLPFNDASFDVVINTVSVDYLTRPFEVFREVGRTLRPGGLFLVLFSNRMFKEKAVKIWRQADEDERVLLVEEFFEASGLFEKPTVFVSKEQPRPRDDKYAGTGLPSDPVYAVYADRRGEGKKSFVRPAIRVKSAGAMTKRELDMRKKNVKDTLRCPHCDEKLKKWAVPDSPFGQTWNNEFMYICFSDECPYYLQGWSFMYKSGNRGVSYRFMFNPEKESCMTIPVPSRYALKAGIIE